MAWLIRFRGSTRSSSAAAREAPGIPETVEAMGIAKGWLYGLGPQDRRKPSTPGPAGTSWELRAYRTSEQHANGPCRGRQTIRASKPVDARGSAGTALARAPTPPGKRQLPHADGMAPPRFRRDCSTPKPTSRRSLRAQPPGARTLMEGHPIPLSPPPQPRAAVEACPRARERRLDVRWRLRRAHPYGYEWPLRGRTRRSCRRRCDPSCRPSRWPRSPPRPGCPARRPRL